MFRMNTPTPDARVATVLRKQRGVIVVEQAEAAGLTRRQADLRVEGGRWRHPARNVYVDAASPDTWQQRATIAWWATRSGDGVLSLRTAGAALDVLRPSPFPH